MGSELIRQLLSRDYQVRAIYNKTPLPDFQSNQIQQFQCDILDIIGLEDAMQDVTEVYHCAAIVTFDPARKRELFKINIEGTTNVVNAALIAGVKKMVHVSSVAALGRIREDGPVNESMNWTEETSNSAYGQSKYLGEMEVWRGIGEGLDAVIVNPSTILGYGDWNNSSCAIFKSAYDEFPWYSNGVNGFVDVEDTARAAVLLMESGISNQRFIINGDNWSFRELFNTMADAFGKKRPHRAATPTLSAIAWRIEKVKSLFSGKPSLLTKESARIAQTTTYFNNRKLCDALPGFAFTPLDQSVKNACNHYLQYL